MLVIIYNCHIQNYFGQLCFVCELGTSNWMSGNKKLISDDLNYKSAVIDNV